MRKDAENLKELERIRPAFDKLNADRIRAEADLARHAAELERATEEARAELGVAEEADIRELIETRRKANTEAVDAFVRAVEDVQSRIAALEPERQ